MLYMKFTELCSSWSLAFIQVHQSHSVHHCYHLSQLQCLQSPHLSFHILMFINNIPHSFLALPPISLSKSFYYHFSKDQLPWSSSTVTAVLHWASLLSQWHQNVVPCQESFRIQLFKMILNVFFTRMCSCEVVPPGTITRSVFTAAITDLLSRVTRTSNASSTSTV
jgi:hypothetical protein